MGHATLQDLDILQVQQQVGHILNWVKEGQFRSVLSFLLYYNTLELK
jgi:hypothetical protein